MTGKKVMMNENEKYEMRIASLPRQILILTWKNLIIFKCNLFGTVLEFLSPFVFLAFLLIIRYYIERIRYNSSLFNQPNSVLDISFFLMNQTRNLVIYYPNNTLIRNFVISAVQLLKFKNPTFDPKGSNVSTAFGLDQATIAQLAVQYSFPASYVNVLPNNIEYTIYTQEDSIFKYKVNSLFPDPVDYKYGRAPEDYCHDSTYFALYSSFNAFKFSMDLQIISYLTGTPIDNTNMLKTMAFNCPYYEQDEYHSTFAFFPCILIAVGFMFSTLFSLGQIVHEKSTKMKEYLKLVGIKWYAIWISWWIRNIFIFLILSVTVTILSRIVLRPTNNSPLFAEKAVLMSTDPLILLLLLLTYSVQVCSFIILFSQFFKKPFDAKVSMLILWVATSINFYNYLPTSVLKYLLCIFPNMGLQFGFQVIFQFERSSRPLGLPQLFTNIYEDPLNLGAIMLTMIIWSIFYLPVTWYMEKIMPGDYGVPLPYYFPFLKSYWFPEFSNTETLGRINSYHVGNQSFERDPKGLQKTVKIMNLSKTFKTFRTSKTVVKNVSINFFENQITGLLGHNGAGKTTTTFMLCGLYPPSSGTAQIFGYDLRTQMDKIRCIMGYCPQVNILFDEFTVEEHLKLIAMIKGFPKLKIDDEIIRISTFVGLSRDLSKKSKNLSGGMKRRLMVAMALMGDSKIIILDEPTSGLDPFNRVKLWELIRKYKNGRTIILTTHFMEEADALSDRIAIMNHGEIRCYGTPLFLKNYYGNGFRVKIVKNLRFNYGEFEALISSYLKEFSVETNVAAELCVSFGFDKVKILPEFLNQLEIDKDVIGIDSYSVSSSTLEEVFLKVGKIDQKYDENENFNDFINVNENAFNSFKEKSVLKSGRALWVQQIQSLLYKRFVVFCRRYILGGMILILPIIFQLILAIIIPSSSAVVDEIGQTVKSEGRVSLDVRNYGSQELVYDLNGSPSPKVHQLFDQFYTYSTRPKVNPVQINGSVVDYVYDKQLNNMVAFIKGHYFGIEWYSPDTDVNKFDIVAYYSKLAYHTPGAVVNEISNLLLSYLNRNKLDETITTYNEPIIPSYSKYYGNDFLKYLGCFDILPLSIFNFSVSLLLSFVISINVMHIAREKINGSKKMQILSNTSKVVYWISNYIFDITIYLINLVSILAVILIVSNIKNDPETDIYLISSYPTLPNLIFVVFLSSLSWPIYTYCWVNFFKSDVTAFAILLILLGVAGFADVLFSFVHIFIHVTEPDLDFDSPGSLMVYAVRILLTILFPNVTIKRELFNFRVRSNRYCISSLNRVIKTNLKYNAAFLDFEEPGVGLFILISFFQIIISILLLIGIETNSLNREFIKNFFYRLVNKNVKYIKINYTIESDVRSEIERVTSSNLKDLAKTEPLVVNRIVKLFKKKQMYFAAVDNLSFGVKAQRCFGLLGLNGAGKTTTFNMIIGEKEPDLGDVYINGHSIQGSQAQARQNLGYCPQFDRLVEYLTVEETLKMFSRLRGIEPALADKISKDMLDIFQLQEFKGTLVQNLSGGNKRKVSCAIAFIGKPSVVILDEPSTGMDPGARKFLWNIIKKARDLGITIVLSSHSMEECEALCDKLAIMLNGQMQCFGTIPELKSRYGDGYRLIIKCNHSESLERDILVLDNFIRMNFPTAFLEDKQYETLFYIVRSSDDDENENESNGDDENNNNEEDDYEEVDEDEVDDMDEMKGGETEVYEEDEFEPKPIKLKIDQENKKKKRRKKKKKDKKNKSQMQNLSRMFSLIETNKKFLNIESYYISQTTLEQLFMSFANRSYQIDESQFRQNSFSLYLSKHRRRRRRKAKVSQLDSEVQLSSTQFQSNQTDNQANTTAVTSQIVLLSFRQFEEQPAAYVPSKKNVNDQYYF